jgi:hypothetical protein
VLACGYPVSEANVCYFTDVQNSGPSSFYPDNYIAVCVAQGITSGKTASTFAPYDNATLAQLISMVVRAAQSLGIVQTASASAAAESISAAGYYDAGPHTANIQTAAASGLLDGLVGYGDTSWNPWANATRGEVAQVLYNLHSKLGPITEYHAAKIELVTADGSQGAIGETHYATFRVTDAAGAPVAGVEVRFQCVQGPGWVGTVSPLIPVITDLSGQVTASLNSLQPGMQRVGASVDGLGTIYVTRSWR